MKPGPVFPVELRRRSIAKAMTWRLAGTLGTCLVGWWITGSLRIGVSIGLVDSGIKILAFYFHERAWHRVSWGFADPALSSAQGENR